MKTLVHINGHKAWAIDSPIENGCKGCMFDECSMPRHMKCTPAFNQAKRNVIYEPYEEELKEKTFTRDEVENLIVRAIEWGYNKCENNSSSWKPYDWIDANL